jgi:hypothetical protein
MSIAQLPIKLTSSAIHPTEDGYYSYDVISFIFPHEPLRRELERGKHAFEKLSQKVLVWKLKYLQTWLTTFLIPIISDHHDSEEKIFAPFYIRLGVEIPENIKGGHVRLVELLMKLEKKMSEIMQNCEDQKEVNVAEISDIYMTMYHHMLEHLQEEEAFWPDAIRSKGEEEYRKVHALVHKDAKQQKSGQLFLMSVLDSMGYEFPGFPHRANDTRWCGDRLLQELIINKIPFFVRSWVFPGINRKYQYYKSMINAVIHSENDESHPTPLDTAAIEPAGSWCILC